MSAKYLNYKIWDKFSSVLNYYPKKTEWGGLGTIFTPVGS